MPAPNRAPGDYQIVKPGEGGRSRWEINGYSSQATPLINANNWTANLQQELQHQYRWAGLLDEEDAARKQQQQQATDKQQHRSRKPKRRSRSSQQFDTSWTEQSIDRLCRASERVKQRTQNLRSDREQRVFTPYNKKEAFRHPMPGYTGFLPRIRSTCESGLTKSEMYSASTKAWVAPRVDVVQKDPIRGKPSDALVEYRTQCLLNIGKASPYLIDLDKPKPLPKMVTGLTPRDMCLPMCDPRKIGEKGLF